MYCHDLVSLPFTFFWAFWIHEFYSVTFSVVYREAYNKIQLLDNFLREDIFIYNDVCKSIKNILNIGNTVL